jgi:hypothetical protein
MQFSGFRDETVLSTEYCPLSAEKQYGGIWGKWPIACKSPVVGPFAAKGLKECSPEQVKNSISG